MHKRFLVMLLLAYLLHPYLLQAELISTDDDVQIFLQENTDPVYSLNGLPVSGQIQKKIWQTKNWRYCEGLFLKRRDGSLARSKDCALDQLSPYEKLDYCRQQKGKISKYTETNYATLLAKMHKCEPWEGKCNLIKGLQYLCEEPSEIQIETVSFNREEQVALQCIFFESRCETDDFLILPKGRSRGSSEGSVLNPGAFHLLLANEVGKRQKSFIYIPDYFYEKNGKRIRAVFNEIVLSYKSKITKINDLYFSVVTVLNVLSEDEHGNDVKKNHRLYYNLQLDSNGNIIGGDWEQTERGPYIVWRPQVHSSTMQALVDGDYLDSLF
jgi:hypothetical protein